MTIEYCRENDGDDDYAALEALITRIVRLATMAKEKDREEDAKIAFMKEAVVGTAWGLPSSSMLRTEHSFQDILNALNTSERDMHRHEAATDRRSTGQISNFRKSLWKSKNRESEK